MTEYVGTVPGLVSQVGVAGGSGHSTRAIPAEDPAYVEAVDRVVAGQRRAGLDRIVEGQLRWGDRLAHPLTIHESVDSRLNRPYYHTGDTFREPIVRGPLTADGTVATELGIAASHTDRLQAVLPGPYTLFDLATDEHYGSGPRFLSALGEFLGGEVASCPPHETLVLLEPSLVTAPPDEVIVTAITEAFEAIAESTEAPIVVHTYWGALDDLTHAHLVDSAIDAIGHDFITAPDACLRLLSEFGSPGSVALGVVDAGAQLVESAATVRERIAWVEEQVPGLDFDTVYVTPNAELRDLPADVMQGKLEGIGTAIGGRPDG